MMIYSIMEWKCKHCLNSFEFENYHQKGNHTRWCEKNPKRAEYVKKLEKARSSLTKESISNMRSSLKKAWENGKYEGVDHGQGFKGRKHTDETKTLMKEKALSSNHRRLVRKTILYNGVLLDGSWELALAKRLDYLDITWTRPSPLKWKDEMGLEHNYFPDFYLPKYDVYLDPKNPQAFRTQLEKINILNETYRNIIWLKSLIECQTFGPIVKGI